MTKWFKNVDWENVRYSIERLTFLEDSIRWLLLACTLLTEVILLAAAAYAGLLLTWSKLPVEQPLLNTVILVAQNIAIDIAGPGSFVMGLNAKRDGNKARTRWSFGLGTAFIFLAICTVSTSSIATSFNLQESDLKGWVVFLIVARVAVSLIFVVVCEVSRKEKKNHRVVQVVNVVEKMEEFQSGLQQQLKQIEASTQQQIERVTETLQQVSLFQQQQVTTISESLTESLKSVETDFQLKLIEGLKDFQFQFQSMLTESLTESLQGIETGFQEYLVESLSPITETLQLHAQTLSILPALTEQLGQISETSQYQLRTVTEQFTLVKTSLEEQSQRLPQLVARIVPQVPNMQPSLIATKTNRRSVQVPARRPESTVSGDFDKEQFVHDCLKEDSEITIAEIQRKAAELKQTISVGSVSTYRKSFFQPSSLKGVEIEEIESLAVVD